MFHFTYNLKMSHNILLVILLYKKIRQATGLLKNSFPLCVYIELLPHT